MTTKTTEFQMKWLLLGSLITNIGSAFIWPLTTIYIHEYLGKPLTTAGLVIFVNCFFALVGNTVGGYLFDHWRPERTIMTGIAIDIVASGILIHFHSWPLYPILLVFTGLGNGIVTTSINGYATQIPHRTASYVFNFLYFTSALGVVLGTLVVGFVLELGIGYIFMAACCMYCIFFVNVWRNYRNKTVRRSAVVANGTRQRVRIVPQVTIVLLTVFTVWCFYEQWDSNLSAYMLTNHLSIKAYSTVWTINAVVIVVLQPLLTRGDDWLTAHLHGRMYVGLLFLASSFIWLAFAHAYWSFAVAMVFISIGEVVALPAVSTYINRFAPATKQGQYQGLVQAAGSGGRAVGPLVGAFVIVNLSYQVLFV